MSPELALPADSPALASCSSTDLVLWVRPSYGGTSASSGFGFRPPVRLLPGSPLEMTLRRRTSRKACRYLRRPACPSPCHATHTRTAVLRSVCRRCSSWSTFIASCRLGPARNRIPARVRSYTRGCGHDGRPWGATRPNGTAPLALRSAVRAHVLADQRMRLTTGMRSATKEVSYLRRPSPTGGTHPPSGSSWRGSRVFQQ